MTIEELYIWAKENDCENYEIESMKSDGSYSGITFAEIEFGLGTVEL